MRTIQKRTRTRLQMSDSDRVMPSDKIFRQLIYSFQYYKKLTDSLFNM